MSSQILALVHPTSWCSIPTTPRLLHFRHFCLLGCDLRAFLLSSLRVPRFPRRRCTNFAAAARLPQETVSICWDALPRPIDDFGRLALSASTSSRINRRDIGTSIGTRTLKTARRVTAVVAYPADGPRPSFRRSILDVPLIFSCPEDQIPVRNLLSRKITGEHLQSSNESIKLKTRQKRHQERKEKQKSKYRKNMINKTQRRAGNL